MGREYRDYYEPPRPMLGALTPGVKWLIVLIGAAYFLVLLSPRLLGMDRVEFLDTFGFAPKVVIAERRWWQPFTYAFVHDVPPIDVLVSVAFLFLAGREVERLLSTRDFIVFYLLAALAGAASYAAASLFVPDAHAPLVGPASCVLGVLVLFSVYYPRLPFVALSVPTWILLVAFALIDLALLTWRGNGAAAIAHAGGAGFGWAWQKAHPRLIDFLNELERRLERREREEARELEERLDDVLRKLNDVGMDGLTSDEKALLHRASRHFRKQKKS